MKYSRAKVESVLAYLAGFERASWQRREQEHFQECYRLVHGCFYGRYTLPRAPAIAVPVSEMAPPKIAPRWQTEKFSHPARKVIKTRVDDASGMVYHELSCGHVAEDFSATPDSLVARWRRCKKCKPESGKKRRTA